ncbi:erythromycin esterase family protein [Microbulbifer salipaludis]|uniref:Erythromycin esterase family protein n=1 Tax=Microbulbifer salipaludis TaxID=187980 RepID=A0ABS3E207_9GAMM|nr:erythromycin esterase family protein [Microbulbifer salipaludis]MBN8429317.1 erythromycin esterase family protein [Microbulbifer salipaludis]
MRDLLIVVGTLLLCAVGTVTPAQAAKPEGRHFSDLQAFGEAVGDRRIVLLDELTHGEHENFALKARLVQYLHREKGFDALVIESGLFDVARIWQTSENPIREQAPGNIFYMYANSAPVNALFDYIDAERDGARPLELAGFDGRLSGEYSLAGAADFIKQQSVRLLPRESATVDWSEYLAITQAALERVPGGFTDAQQARFIENSYRLIQGFNGLPSRASGYDRPDYVARLVHGLVIVAQNLWGTRRHDEHDIAMADNLRWLLENRYKDKKVIVWGHFIHLNYGGTVPHRFDNLGTLLRRDYGKDMYLAHIAAVKGQYRDFVDMQVKAISPGQGGMLEAQIVRDRNVDGSDAIFLDGPALDHVVRDAGDNARFYGHQYRHPIASQSWSHYWDGMFILPNSTASAADRGPE